MLSALARTRILSVGLLMVGALLGLPSCAADGQPPAQVHITATIFPLASWTAAVAGERAHVNVMVPAGVDPHYWEATADAIIAMEASAAFIYVDTDYEFWLAGMLQEWDAENDGPPRVGLLRQVDPLPASDQAHGDDHGDDDHDHAHDDEDPGHHHDHGDDDPHFWTDPLRAIMAVAAIRDLLMDVDPEGADIYAANAAAYVHELTALHERFDQSLADCGHDLFISTHAAFRYLADRYRLDNLAIMAVVPEAEPSPRDLEQIIATARERELEYVFYETAVSPAASETVAIEVGAQTLLLHPLEAVTAAELANGETYLSLMAQNMDHLRLALACP